ncbi:MAG: hypothetical protein ABI950_09425 [Solirubrobacteraceae bacterium]
MSRQRLPLIASALAVVAGAIAAVLILHARDRHTTPATDRVDPLAFMPSRAPVVLDLDTKQPLIALAVQQLAPRLTSGRLTVDAVDPLLGGRVAIALDGNRAWLAFATSKPAPAGTTRAKGVVLYAPDPAAARAATAQAAEPPAAYARDTFVKRFDGLPADAGARVAFDPRRLLGQREPKLAATRWGRSLRDGAAVLARTGDGLRVPFRVTAEPVGLSAADLPFATGPAAPPTNGHAALTVGVRDPAQTVAFAREADLVPALTLVDSLPGIVKPNLSDLGPAATLTSADTRTVSVRTTPPDPGDWDAKLNAIDTFSSLIGGLGITQRHGAFAITQNGALLARAGVYGPALMLSNDPRADLRALATAPATPPLAGAHGGLTIAGSPDQLKAYLPGIVLSRIRALNAWARVETTGLTGELQIPLR